MTSGSCILAEEISGNDQAILIYASCGPLHSEGDEVVDSISFPTSFEVAHGSDRCACPFVQFPVLNFRITTLLLSSSVLPVLGVHQVVQNDKNILEWCE